MSQYIPDPAKCTIVEGRGGWWIADQFDVFDGPYSHLDAVAVLCNMQREWSAYSLCPAPYLHD